MPFAFIQSPTRFTSSSVGGGGRPSARSKREKRTILYPGATGGGRSFFVTMSARYFAGSFSIRAAADATALRKAVTVSGVAVFFVSATTASASFKRVSSQMTRPPFCSTTVTKGSGNKAVSTCPVSSICSRIGI